MKFIFVRIDDCTNDAGATYQLLEDGWFFVIEQEDLQQAVAALGLILDCNSSGKRYAVYSEAGVVDVMRHKKEPLPFQVGQTYMDREGTPVRIVSADRKASSSDYTLIGLRWDPTIKGEEYESIECYLPNGQYDRSSPGAYDLQPKYAEPPTDFSFTPLQPKDEKETQA